MELPIEEFVDYIVDICEQAEPAVSATLDYIGSSMVIDRYKIKVILERLADTSVRVASTKLLNKDIDISKMSNQELADAMRKHVTFRSSGKTESKLPNSAWSMMLEASARLGDTK